MEHKAQIFMNGRSQAVRLPLPFRFDTKEIFIRQDPETGDIILSRKPENWDSFFELLKNATQNHLIPEDFLSVEERNENDLSHDPFVGWSE
jgi:antitoxin VapB